MVNTEGEKNIPDYARILVADARFAQLHPKLRILLLTNEELIEEFFPGESSSATVVSDLHNIIVGVQQPAWRWLRTKTGMSEIRWRQMRQFPLFYYPDERVNDKIREEFLATPSEVLKLTDYRGILLGFQKLVKGGIDLHIATAGLVTDKTLNIELLANLGFINETLVPNPFQPATEPPVPICNFWQRSDSAVTSTEYKIEIVKKVKAKAEINDDPAVSGEISLLNKLAFWVSHGTDLQFIREHAVRKKAQEIRPDLQNNPYFIPCPSPLYAVRQLLLVYSLALKAKGEALTEQLHHNILSKPSPVLYPGLIL